MKANQILHIIKDHIGPLRKMEIREEQRIKKQRKLADKLSVSAFVLLFIITIVVAIIIPNNWHGLLKICVPIVTSLILFIVWWNNFTSRKIRKYLDCDAEVSTSETMYVAVDIISPFLEKVFIKAFQNLIDDKKVEINFDKYKLTTKLNFASYEKDESLYLKFADWDDHPGLTVKYPDDETPFCMTGIWVKDPDDIYKGGALEILITTERSIEQSRVTATDKKEHLIFIYLSEIN